MGWKWIDFLEENRTLLSICLTPSIAGAGDDFHLPITHTLFFSPRVRIGLNVIYLTALRCPSSRRFPPRYSDCPTRPTYIMQPTMFVFAEHVLLLFMSSIVFDDGSTSQESRHACHALDSLRLEHVRKAPTTSQTTRYGLSPPICANSTSSSTHEPRTDSPPPCPIPSSPCTHRQVRERGKMPLPALCR